MSEVLARGFTVADPGLKYVVRQVDGEVQMWRVMSIWTLSDVRAGHEYPRTDEAAGAFLGIRMRAGRNLEGAPVWVRFEPENAHVWFAEYATAAAYAEKVR